MSQYTSNFFGVAIPTSFGQSEVGFNVQSITIYNNTPAQLAVFGSEPGPGGSFPFGGIIVPAFYPITIPVIGWRGYWILTDKTVTFAASSLVVFLTDQPLTGQPLSPFGPSGWGAGADPASLTQINPGDALLAWQIRQFYLALTGVIPVTALLVDREDGSYQIEIRRLAAPAATYGLAVESVAGALALDNVLTATRLVTFGATGRITAPSVGASAKPLLNFVPLTNPVVIGSVTGAGDATLVNLSLAAAIPTSAVAVAGELTFQQTSAGAVNMAVHLFYDTSGTVAFGDVRLSTAFAVNQAHSNGVVGPCVNQAIAYSVGNTGGANWSFTFTVTGYWEAS